MKASRSNFFLFQSYLDFAHLFWKQLLQEGDQVIDATCGNGHDTLAVAKMFLTSTSGKIYALDIQEAAIKSTQERLEKELTAEVYQRIQLIQKSHAIFPSWMAPKSIKLIIYNLGYLPGGNKQITTLSETTINSLKHALELLMPGGAISMTCYPGHLEGAREEKLVSNFVETLDPKNWNCCHHRWLNRQQSASLFLIQKKIESSS